MKTFTIKPGNIACSVEVYVDGETLNYFYMSDSKAPEGSPKTEKIHRFDSLPEQVKAEINKHFDTIFNLPIERRGEYLKYCVPTYVNAEMEG